MEGYQISKSQLVQIVDFVRSDYLSKTTLIEISILEFEFWRGYFALRSFFYTQGVRNVKCIDSFMCPEKEHYEMSK